MHSMSVEDSFADNAALLGSKSSSFRSYGTSVADVNAFDRQRKEDLASSVRRRTSQRPCCVTVGGEEYGTGIQSKLEEIFGRASEGMPSYEELGKVEGIAKSLHTSLRDGIDAHSAAERRRFFGKNALPEDPPLTFWEIYKGAWEDSMIRLLAAAALVSLVLGLTVPEPGETRANYKTGWIEGFAILCSVFIVTSVSSVNDYRKEQKFHKLTEENSAQPIRVRRDGAEVTVDVTEIVVGDVVNLSPGLVVPVDGFFVRGMSVVIDESSVTGENDPKKKNAEAPIILTGTVVNTAEDAYMLACAVGERSFGGKLLMESRGAGAPRPTPLQERLDDLAEKIGRIGISAAAVLFVILACIEIADLVRHRPNASYKHFLDYFILCVTVVVVAVPEGLPLAVTIALAYSQNKMHDDNNQVRRLRACETMGNATQICSDKTGTLTQNRMSVVQGYVGMQRFRVAQPGDIPQPITCLHDVNPRIREMLVESLAINSSSEKVVSTTDKEGHAVAPYWQWMTDKGNKTDNALLDFVDRAMLADADVNNMKERPHQRMRAACHKRGFMLFPFTSDRKRMSAVVRQEDGTLLHHVKGGSDRVLPLCDRYVNEAGEEVPMTDDVRNLITAQLRTFATDANRTIGVAYTTLSGKELPEDEPTEKLVWLCLIGIHDPLRPEVAEAVQKCQMAGVTVRMCTGDNLDTALAISRECGIFNRSRGDLAMTGQDFRNLVYDAYGDEERMEKFWPVLDHMTVMARSQPLDKQLLVLMLMVRGEVVAVTGDGTNDAPALRLANVGFVMRSGTDIAVKSADIVLLDDNFRSVQRAVVWGRCVNDNIRKFLQLQLTVNYVSVALTFIGSVMTGGASSPLTTVQLLWVNLIMDTLAALALATEEPSEDCLRRGPVSRKAPLISRRMHVTIGAAAAYMLALTLAVQAYGNVWFRAGPLDGVEHQTIVFNVFVLSTLIHMFNCRKLYDELNMFEGLWSRSRPLIAVLVFCFGFQILAVETFGDFMNVTSLRGEEWFACFMVSVIVLITGFISRLIPVKEAVYEKTFDAQVLDSDARTMLAKIDITVATAQESDTSYGTGEYLDKARRLRARALWREARQHHVNAGRVVRAFRRARAEKLEETSGFVALA
ncbi:putative mitochondrial vacuolar-type Ca2 -ATPase [Leptomonas pyrrhocoris]|uniref:Calcium-transporting ATPase n=1 Tax=Leptomonas pyrrhocoris TaxID=157538 RepID=A0A0M9FR13_LEPPY|nr:putative mitochondrial vacuolar-type Ca2 -ATPase [Leptomonas pyrrhocoris]XP_015652749.1 putative mitochondrial vacuolar-type Ca2 -ATPase [Leptomonas pyrrhocoris]KPA74309.1 putative mitochondrial vacuolar-type Ca2 -ATPase [Leptomonas pyrrhocoris]KPA74310.1 putative mitochondrial vacuolar-type Ca2 -ATPase [Leptomonas pyrrhocoris]|eukprot:XP_015652748.1 putative mitochondrial vacuolar-type Ca2 -ATPase [Leptomonas pyrrhocoris]